MKKLNGKWCKPVVLVFTYGLVGILACLVLLFIINFIIGFAGGLQYGITNVQPR